MTITALPSAPLPTDNTATFNSKAFALVAALDNFVTEANATGVAADADAASAFASAIAAGLSEDAAIAAANFKGAWSTLSGALAIPASVSHLSKVWILTESVANVTTEVPGTSAKWLAVSVNFDSPGVIGGDTPGVGNFTSVNTQNTFGFKNRIINGAMQIDQRNAGASVTATTSDTFSVDRWACGATVNSKYSAQQNAGSITAPVGFTNYLGATSLSAYSVAAGDIFWLQQSIEGLNVADLSWGTANAKPVTLSFQVYSSLTGTFGGALRNNAGNRSYPFSYSVPVANTWTTISVTISGDTTGTWLTTNGVGIRVGFGLGVGSTYSGTAGAWSASNLLSATGAVSVVGTSGATFYITGVQLELGSTATSFDVRDYGRELIMCQRYLPAFIPTTSSNGQGSMGQCYSTTNALMTIQFQTTTRVAPSGLSVTNATNFSLTNAGSGRGAVTTFSFNGASQYGAVFDAAIASGLVAGNATILWASALPCQILFTGCEL